jgi:hypothetical protein
VVQVVPRKAKMVRRANSWDTQHIRIIRLLMYQQVYSIPSRFQILFMLLRIPPFPRSKPNSDPVSDGRIAEIFYMTLIADQSLFADKIK